MKTPKIYQVKVNKKIKNFQIFLKTFFKHKNKQDFMKTLLKQHVKTTSQI